MSAYRSRPQRLRQSKRDLYFQAANAGYEMGRRRVLGAVFLVTIIVILSAAAAVALLAL